VLLIDIHGDNSDVLTGAHPAAVLVSSDGLRRMVSIDALAPAWFQSNPNGEFHSWLLYCWYDLNSDSVLCLCESDPLSSCAARLVSIKMKDASVSIPDSDDIEKFTLDPVRESRIGALLSFALLPAEQARNFELRQEAESSAFESGLAELISARQLDRPIDDRRLLQIAATEEVEWNNAVDSAAPNRAAYLRRTLILKLESRVTVELLCRLSIHSVVRGDNWADVYEILVRNRVAALKVINADFPPGSCPEAIEGLRASLTGASIDGVRE